jgi:hypothetical protein
MTFQLRARDGVLDRFPRFRGVADADPAVRKRSRNNQQ